MVLFIALSILSLLLLKFGLIGGGKTPLQKENVLATRGILAVFIILHHTTYDLPGTLFDVVFGDVGMWICGIFFLQSGYALGLQRENYRMMSVATFIHRRLINLAFDAIFISCFYQMILLFLGKWDFFTSVELMKHGNTSGLLPFSWFIWELLLLYVFYYLSNKTPYPITSLLVLCIFMIIIMRVLHFGCEWYMSTFSFPVGVMLASFNKPLSNQRLAGLSLCSMVCYWAYYKFHLGPLLILIIPLLSVSMNYLLAHCCFHRFKSFLYMASVSFYMYMVQGIVIEFFHTEVSVPSLMFPLSILSCTFFVSLLYKKFRKSIQFYNKNY